MPDDSFWKLGPEGPPLVFIHGIKGSTLEDTARKTRWLTFGQALGISNPELALSLNWDNANEQESDSLRPVAPLASVRVLPGILEQEVYRPWLKAARASGFPVYPFAYDWRRDNLECLDRFHRFIRGVREVHAGARVRVVAHSMGGLITLALLNREPEIFQSVVFAGVPFSGGIGFLKDMHEGVAIGFNRRILSPRVLFTFPSVYALFPRSGVGLLDNRGSPLPMDFYSAGSWMEMKLGIFADGSPFRATPPAEAERRHLAFALERAKAFRDLLHPARREYPPILVVSGRSRPTLLAAVRGGPKSLYGWDFESAATGDGDGRVIYEHSLPPAGIQHRVFHSEYEHSALLNDPRVLNEIWKA